MTWIAPDVDRSYAPYAADERSMLEGWLDWHRYTLLHKCSGLANAQLIIPSVEPSNLTLLGLVRHMALVERFWFRQRFAGQDVPDLYCAPDNPDGDFDDVASADPAVDFATFHEEIALARQAVAGRGLDETFLHRRHGRERTINLRWVYLHMIEEYARHNGHADFLREALDGRTGE